MLPSADLVSLAVELNISVLLVAESSEHMIMRMIFRNGARIIPSS